MKYKQQKYSITKLVEAWRDASLKVNTEYQRGASWSLQQMQGLIDSIFRQYPIPPIFLHRIVSRGLESESIRFEIVDGQQRIRALAAFFDDKVTLLSPQDKKLRLPASIRQHPAPWSERTYTQLTTEDRTRLDSTEIDVFVIEATSHPDEVRDLFIRLQSGTALSRQQIRDAWPGNVGPAVEQLAGKLDRKPTCDLFRLVDKRGQRIEDERDPFISDRQFCAQLLCLFIARERDPLATPSIGAPELDALYHEHTMLDTSGPTWSRFVSLLNEVGNVVGIAGTLSGSAASGVRRKFRKLDVISVFLLLQDLTKSAQFRLDSSSRSKLSRSLLSDGDPLKASRSTEGSEIRRYYEAWRKTMPEELGIRRDTRRLFTEEQREQIRLRDRGICGVCTKPILDGDDEVDHYPIPWRDGGPTEINNGRIVHKLCHERGQHFDL